MKKTIIFFSSVFLCFSISVFSQKNSEEANPNINPFAKGKWQTYLTTQNLGYSRKKVEFNNNSRGHVSNFNFNWSTNYFVGKGIGLGLDLQASSSKTDNAIEQTNSFTMAYFNLVYGNRITGNVFYYVRAGAGIGRAGFKRVYPGMTDKDHNNLTGLRGQVGLPIRLGDNSPAFFTPELSYGSTRYHADGYTETDNSFGLGLRLESYLFCRQVSCGCRNGQSLAKNMYEQGNSYLGISTMGGVQIGNTKTKFDDSNIPTDKDDYNNVNLSAEYMYYVAKNFNIGASLSYGGSVNKDKASNNKFTTAQYSIAPMLEYNLPFTNLSLNSFYVRGSIELGGATFKSKINNGNTNTDKFTITGPSLGLGYNWFFSDKLALSLNYQYEWYTIKNKDTDEKQKENGSDIVVGIRKFFPK